MSLTGAEKAARLQLALDYGGATHRLTDVVDMLQDGRARLFENDGGVIIAELERFPLLNAVRFWLIAGELQACLALQDEVIAWGRTEGCSIATATGRRGWGRVAAPTGWREWHRNFIRRLDHVQ
jgi:hypothetical protein